MSNVNMEGLPPEMQARIQQIIEGAKQKAVANTQPQPQRDPVAQAEARARAGLQPEAPAPAAPVPAKVPNLMDHTIALRQEVAALRQELHAAGQVIEAVGQAVGQLYATFQSQTVPSNYGPEYEEALQAHQQSPAMNEDY